MQGCEFYKNQIARFQDYVGSGQSFYIRRGIEKENIRVDSQGLYAKTNHPHQLGHPLFYPAITTDFAEVMLECVTEPHTQRSSLMVELKELTHWIAHGLSHQPDPEYLWPYSFPFLGSHKQANSAPIAHYGDTHAARMKSLYRLGLASRYGKAMQMITGLHYNVSFPPSLLNHLGELPHEKLGCHSKTAMSSRYMGLIRNVIRYQWVLPYLFGCSPICFPDSLSHANLPGFLAKKEGILFAEDATSLRLSEVGYSNTIQANLAPSFDSVESYTSDLLSFTGTAADFLSESQQPTTATKKTHLQIEDEYYFPIRPKVNPIHLKGRRPIHALRKHGIEYIELRSLDLNPLSPYGIDENTLTFIDLFLMHLLFMPSPPLTNQEWQDSQHNLACVVSAGRSAHCSIKQGEHEQLLLLALGELLNAMPEMADLLDRSTMPGDSQLTYKACLHEQRGVVEGRSTIRAHSFVEQWVESDQSFIDFVNALAARHMRYLLERPLSESRMAHFDALAKRSHQEALLKEKNETGTFENYVKSYFDRY